MKDKKERTEKSDIRTPFSDFIRKFMKQKTAVAAAAVLVLIVLAAVFADLIAPFGINEYSYDDQLQGPTQSICSARMNSAAIYSAGSFTARASRFQSGSGQLRWPRFSGRFSGSSPATTAAYGTASSPGSAMCSSRSRA